MTTPDYRTPPPKKPLAVQAALFAFWTPVVALLLALVVNLALGDARAKASVLFRQTFHWFIVALLAAALIAGVVALAGMRRHGPRGILVRSCAGVLVSLLFLGYVAVSTFFLGPEELIGRRLVGTWHSTLHMPGNTVVGSSLTLRPDHSTFARFSMWGKSMPVSGRWAVTWDAATQTARLAVTWNPGADSRLGTGVVWIIERIEPDRLTLQGRQGPDITHETYVRSGDSSSTPE
jgi:hypothetical protein